MKTTANDSLRLSGKTTPDAEGMFVVLLSNNPNFTQMPKKIINNQFNFSVKIPNPDQYAIGLYHPNTPGNVKYLNLFLGNEQVDITIIDTIGNYRVNSGSTALAFQGLQHNFGPLFEELNRLSNAFQSAGTYRYNVDSLNGVRNAVNGQIAKSVPNYLKEYGNTPVAPFLLQIIYPLNYPIDQMASWVALIPDKMWQTNYGFQFMSVYDRDKLFGIGAVPPNFTQNNASGKAISLTDFKGKYVLIDFWASWCGPCRQENPNLVNSFNRFSKNNFTILGVSLDKEKIRWEDAIVADKLTWTHVSDLGYWNNAVAKLYGINSIPQNLLLDPEGKILAKNLRGADLDSFLEQLFAK